MKFKTEQASIDFFIGVLRDRGYSNIVRTKNPFEYYDLQAEKSGQIYRFELKRRDMPSNRYNDGIMELYKLNEFFAHREEYNHAVLVSFFDDCWAISNVKSPIGESIKTASHTTDFSDKRKVKKDFVHYSIKKYDY